jgi:23S rRNA (uracil1939-C5)-methyltransferase
VFIPNVVPGDVIDVQTFKSASLIMKEKQFIFMNIQNTIPNLYASTLVFAVAKWQNMKYIQQLYYKQNEVLNHLQRIGKVELPDFEPILVQKNSFLQK